MTADPRDHRSIGYAAARGRLWTRFRASAACRHPTGAGIQAP